jgi:hypothetical protein
MLQCRFLTIRILWNLSPKSRKWHFRESRFKNFPDEQALDPLENSCIYGARLVPLALLLGGAFENFEPGTLWYNVTPLCLFPSCQRLVDNLLQGCWARQTGYKLFQQLVIVLQFNSLSTSCEWQPCSNLIKKQHCYNLLTSLLQACCEHILLKILGCATPPPPPPPQKWFASPRGIWHRPQKFCTPANYIYFDLIVSYLIILTTKFVKLPILWSQIFLGLSGRCHQPPAKASSSTPPVIYPPPPPRTICFLYFMSLIS